MTTAQTPELDVQPTPLALLLLGREADPKGERGVECPGDPPSPPYPALVERARAAKDKLGDKVFVLGHHYQRDEVIQFADVTGDSFKLARDAAAPAGGTSASGTAGATGGAARRQARRVPVFRARNAAQGRGRCPRTPGVFLS